MQAGFSHTVFLKKEKLKVPMANVGQITYAICPLTFHIKILVS